MLFAHQYDMGGFPVKQPFPTQQVEQVDPFLLLHHADVKVPTRIEPRHAGVGPHPHRGFSPVTFIFKGGVHHRDSRGNDSVIYAGGAQWMNAGRGIIHSERPPHDIHEHGGRQEIIQLWINTPAAHKMDQPEYFPLTAEEAPVKVSEDSLINMLVFAGQLAGAHGPIATKTDVNAATASGRPGGKMFVELPPSHNAFIYLLHGKLSIDGYGLMEEQHAAIFDTNGDGIGLTVLEDAQWLLMSGEPLNEKVVSHGPFVMNDETEILEAMRDYQMGKMGVLIED